MPDRPLIILPEPSLASRGNVPRGGSRFHLPSRDRQGTRITPQFEVLLRYFEQRALDLRQSAAGQIPEEIIVFETVGTVANFLETARQIPGFDFMAEWDVEDIAPDEDFYDETNEDMALPGRLFLIMTNRQALDQLLGLWRRFQNGDRARKGFGPSSISSNIYMMFADGQ